MSQPISFRLDGDASQVAIHATSSVHPIEAVAGGIAGTVELAVADGRPDLGQPAGASISLPVNRINARNTVYDTELRRRLDARRHPAITGELTGAEASGGVYLLTGDLTLRGVTRSVTVEAAVTLDGDERLEASWEQTIDIRDFGLKPPRVLMLRVHPEVRVTVSVVATRV